MSTPERPDADGASEGAPITTRWIDGGENDPRAARAGALLRSARVDEALSAPRLAAVRAKLGDERRWADRLAGRFAGHSWAFQLSFAVALLLALSTLVVAATKVTRWFVERSRAQPVEVVAPPPARAPRHRRAHAKPGVATTNDQTIDDETIDDLAPDAPAVVAEAPLFGPAVPSRVEPPPVVAPARAAPSRARALNTPSAPRARVVEPAPPLAPPPTEAPAPGSPLAEESALLARALRALRQDNDAPAALRLFDEHAARFAGGALVSEARVGRTEALLQLGRRAEALTLLDAMTLPQSGRRRDMLVTRGELRAGVGRCAEALIDFGLALTSDARDDVAAERALYGRASCRARLGDADGARTDLEAYLGRFPKGRFVADARAMLER